jgi:predicted nucleotide-binding protein
MTKYRDGEWYVFEEKTTKSFQQFRTDVTTNLLQGFFGMTTTHAWKGNSCHIHSFGSEGIVTYEEGQITCRARLSLWMLALKSKILSDIENVTANVSGSPAPSNKDVFIAHGHNDAIKLELKTYLAGLGLNPIILSEQNDLGFTIVEKFEYFASACSFAFILMTPDDRAITKSDTDSRWRARQNVIMELGWFMARLGRDRVVILFSGELELPSDILGVVFLEFEEKIDEVAGRIYQRLKGVELVP